MSSTLKKGSTDRMLSIDNIRWSMIVLVVIMHLKVTYGNQGMWYFGAKIAKTEFMLEKCLANPHATIERHIIELKANAQAILEAEL